MSEGFDFFELLRQLERGGRLFGHGGRPDREPARLGQQVRLAFATRDVAHYVPGPAGRPGRVTVANFGLLGPEGPMPLHLTRWVLDRLSQRWFAGAEASETSDTTFVDFANVLQHRMIALFYRAWADAHPGVQSERAAGSSRVGAMLQALSGIGLPGTRAGNAGESTVRLRQAASLAHQVEGPERLCSFLREAFGVPAAVREFVAAWLPIPKPLQTRLGQAHAALGRGAVIGPRTFGRQDRIELRIGPLDLSGFRAFLPGEERLKVLRGLVRELAGGVLDVDLRIVLARDEVPAARLGAAQLARTAWLPAARRRDDAGDMLLRAFVGWRPDAAGAPA